LNGVTRKIRRYLVPGGFDSLSRHPAAANKLTTDQQRDNFISAFWERRNPNPASPENAFEKEHYRRIAYANEHFAANVPGWKTDRGRTYIIYGPPNSVESSDRVSAPSEI
jgi:GWxTD domain-containing protein